MNECTYPLPPTPLTVSDERFAEILLDIERERQNMFSVAQKRDIADAVQKILRATNHPELPDRGEVSFHLHVDGAESWSWADIRNNGAVLTPSVGTSACRTDIERERERTADAVDWVRVNRDRQVTATVTKRVRQVPTLE